MYNTYRTLWTNSTIFCLLVSLHDLCISRKNTWDIIHVLLQKLSTFRDHSLTTTEPVNSQTSFIITTETKFSQTFIHYCRNYWLLTQIWCIYNCRTCQFSDPLFNVAEPVNLEILYLQMQKVLTPRPFIY